MKTDFRTKQKQLHFTDVMEFPVIKPANDRTEDEKKRAMENDKETHAFLKRLRRKGGNDRCADCNAKHAGWTALPHGVFLCIDCAQVHRGIGRHISQVKSASSGTYLWYPDEVNALVLMGNRRANSIYLANMHPGDKPSEFTSRSSIEKHIRLKYVERKWFGTPRDTFSNPNDRNRANKVDGTTVDARTPRTKSADSSHSDNPVVLAVARARKPCRSTTANALSAKRLDLLAPDDLASCPSDDLITCPSDSADALRSVVPESHEMKSARIMQAFKSSEFFSSYGVK
mmetsp:Transcript_8147/g.13143  ORF Transcript_8147/g.13143 Transcript_8147/m.13143 type:complete len:286 (-) Transcript_8147:243-1100(-)